MKLLAKLKKSQHPTQKLNSRTPTWSRGTTTRISRGTTF